MAGGNWVLWWRIDFGRLDEQVKQYDSLNLFNSARGMAALCLNFTVAGSLIAIWQGFQGTQGWGLIDVALMAILAFYVWRGHRWAMLGAMAVWSVKSVVIASGAVGQSNASIAGAVFALFWWCIFMHVFYFAYRVERRRRRLFHERGDWHSPKQIVRHALGTAAMFLLLICVLMACGTAFVAAALDGYRAGDVDRGAVVVTALNYRVIGWRWGEIALGRGDDAAAFAFDRADWQRFTALWHKARNAAPGPRRLIGNLSQGSAVLSVYADSGVHLEFGDNGRCWTADIAPAGYPAFEAAMRRLDAHFDGHLAGPPVVVDPWRRAQRLARTWLRLSPPAVCHAPLS